ncbi:hypothetical protein ACA910_008653 [Epithemia clementina (nom. ined.)]
MSAELIFNGALFTTRTLSSLWALMFFGYAILVLDGVEAFQPRSSPARVQRNIAVTGSPLEGSDTKIGVALTREEGKNAKLLKALDADESLRTMIQPFELPCIAHADGPDFDRLHNCLLNESWDYVIVTSPEAARVLASAWDSAKMGSTKVAAVGKATEQELSDNSIHVVFTPSKAYGTTLVEELPGSKGTKVLYPASCRAPGTVADGLEQRGFVVTRLDTYDTVTASWGESEQKTSQQCQIACFASPSSIHGWLENTGNNKEVVAACIGATSAKACQELGWDDGAIFFSPGSPGIDGWVDSIRNAVEKLNGGAS